MEEEDCKKTNRGRKRLDVDDRRKKTERKQQEEEDIK